MGNLRTVAVAVRSLQSVSQVPTLICKPQDSLEAEDDPT